MKTPSRSVPEIRAVARRPSSDDGGIPDARPPEILSLEDREMVLRGLQQARDGDFATEEEVRATLRRFRV